MTCESAPFNIVGTDSSMDLSDYAELHVVAKGTVAYSGSCCKFGTVGSFNIASYTAESYVTTAGVTDDYMVNISSISSGYIYVTCTDARAAEIYEIYLVPKQRKYIIKDGVLQDGFSLSATNYNYPGYSSTCNATITYNNEYIQIYSTFPASWGASGSIFLDNQLNSVTVGTILYVEAVTNYTNFDSRYPTAAGSVKFSQVSGKVNKFAIYSSSNPIVNTQSQKTIYSVQCTNTSKYFVFPELTIEAQTGTATCTINIYNAWLY